MAETKIIKCQAWVSGNSLVQDQILITSDGKSSENTVVLIQNIWNDLTTLDNSHEYKTNKKGYFYWEVDMTSMEDDDITVKVNIECPKPDVNIDPFRNPEPSDQWTPSEISENYAKYWITKLDKIMKDAENEYAIQRKEVVFGGVTYQDQQGNDVVLPDYTFTNSDLGDITNLLSMF
jgi:hypothetical protein